MSDIIKMNKTKYNKEEKKLFYMDIYMEKQKK